MTTKPPSFNVTPSKVSFFMTLVGVIALGWQVASYFKSHEAKNLEQDMRIERLAVEADKTIRTLEKLTVKADELKEAVVRLTVTLENSQGARKAELPSQTFESYSDKQSSLTFSR